MGMLVWAKGIQTVDDMRSTVRPRMKENQLSKMINSYRLQLFCNMEFNSYFP